MTNTSSFLVGHVHSFISQEIEGVVAKQMEIKKPGGKQKNMCYHAQVGLHLQYGIGCLLRVKDLGRAVGSVEPARQLAELPGLAHGLGVWGQQEDERRLVVGGVQRREGRPRGRGGGAWGRTPGAFKVICKIEL